MTSYGEALDASNSRRIVHTGRYPNCASSITADPSRCSDGAPTFPGFSDPAERDDRQPQIGRSGYGL